MVIVSPWIGNELGDSTSWQTPPYQLATFGTLPVIWLKKHLPGSLALTSTFPELDQISFSVSLGPFSDWGIFLHCCMCSTSLEDFVHFFGFPECFIPRILKQKNENCAKLQGVEGKGATSPKAIPEFGKSYSSRQEMKKSFTGEKKSIFF